MGVYQNISKHIMVEQNKPLIVDNIKIPNELNAGQVFVQIEVSGICGSQLGEISGVKGPTFCLTSWAMRDVEEF